MKSPDEMGKLAMHAAMSFGESDELIDKLWTRMPAELRRTWVDAASAVRQATLNAVEDHLRAEAAKRGDAATFEDRTLTREANNIACGAF